MFEQLLKGFSQSSQNSRKASDGWDQPPVRVNRVSQERGQSETPAFLSKIGSLGVYVEEYDSEQDQPAIGISASVEQSIKNSQVLSINEIGNNCDEGHPMIISQIDNRAEINNQFVKKIKISAFQLRQLCIQLAEYLDEQRNQQQQLKYKMMQQLADITRKMASSSQRRSIETPCSRCQELKKQMNLLITQKNKIEQNLQSVTLQKDRLQEQTFDMQQKMYGIDLQVEKRIKQKEKNRGLMPISPIPQQTKEIIEHLEHEITNLNDKLRNYQSMLQSMPSKDQLRDLKEREKDIEKRQAALQQQLTHLQMVKQASYQREHEILLAQENLSKKIAEMRKKQAQLSQWEAEVAKRKREDRTVHRDNTLAQQFPSNDPSFQQSVQELNNSRQMSLKSFGKNPHLQQKGFSPSSEELENIQTPFYKPRTQADQQIRNRRQPKIQPQNYPLLQGRTYKPAESNYIPKARRDNIQPGIAKRYNAQISNYSREASPYRVLNQPARGREGAQMYQLPRTSPGHFRQISKNSRSTSKSKVGALVQGQLAARNQKDNQLGGLGSKLERLREQIKRQIDSIK